MYPCLHGQPSTTDYDSCGWFSGPLAPPFSRPSAHTGADKSEAPGFQHDLRAGTWRSCSIVVNGAEENALICLPTSFSLLAKQPRLDWRTFRASPPSHQKVPSNNLLVKFPSIALDLSHTCFTPLNLPPHTPLTVFAPNANLLCLCLGD